MQGKCMRENLMGFFNLNLWDVSLFQPNLMTEVKLNKGNGKSKSKLKYKIKRTEFKSLFWTYCMHIYVTVWVDIQYGCIYAGSFVFGSSFGNKLQLAKAGQLLVEHNVLSQRLLAATCRRPLKGCC